MQVIQTDIQRFAQELKHVLTRMGDVLTAEEAQHALRVVPQVAKLANLTPRAIAMGLMDLY